MFGSSFSPSWTYMVILFKNGEDGHKVIEFTLPSNQTEYANDNINAYRYFMQYLLKDLGYVILGVVSSEDYINIERVGISKELACKFALEREAKEEKKPHSFYSKEFFKILKGEEDDVEKSITIDQLRNYVQLNSRKGPVFNFTLNVADIGNSVIINFTHPDEASDFLAYIKKYHKECGHITLANILNYLGLDEMAEDWNYGWYNIEGMEIIDRMMMPNNQIYSIVFPSSAYIKYS
jgi:hypothetical protein